MKEERLVFRADADSRIGTAHVMRCLALAQAWIDTQGAAVFVCAAQRSALAHRLWWEGVEAVRLAVQPGSAEDASQTADLALRAGASWAVVDGYHFDAAYQRIVKDAGLRLLVIDDHGYADPHHADIVLNQNLHADERMYARRGSGARLLLGARYALLRREFLRWRGWRRQTREVGRRVLVTLGGADPDNLTGTVIEALGRSRAGGLEVVVVVGEANPHLPELEAAAQASRLPVRIETRVADMAELMAWADAALSAGGCTSWELAFMGLPAAAMWLAGNQQPVVQELAAAGACLSLGEGARLNPDTIGHALRRMLRSRDRGEMSRRGRELVDGRGAARVVAHLKQAPGANPQNEIRLRPAGDRDCRLIWEWSNDPAVRAASFSSAHIPWSEHVRWFRSKLHDPSCVFYIATDTEDRPVGQVRYDIRDGAAVVSLSMDRKRRGLGRGSVLIRLASRALFDTTPVSVIHAYVKEGNEASARIFMKAGYTDEGATVVRGQPALRFALSRRGSRHADDH